MTSDGLDDNGNRTHVIQTEPLSTSAALNVGSTSYTFNTPKNRLVAAGGSSFGYDDEGQLNSGYGASYTFDSEYRLKTAGTNQYFYDGASRRLKAVRNGVTTKYIYDAGGNLLAESDENNNITRYYIYGANGLIAMIVPGTTDQIY